MEYIQHNQNPFNNNTSPNLFNDIFKKRGPILVEILVPENVIMIPSVSSIRLENGLFKSNKLDEMSPYLKDIHKSKD